MASVTIEDTIVADITNSQGVVVATTEAVTLIVVESATSTTGTLTIASAETVLLTATSTTGTLTTASAESVQITATSYTTSASVIGITTSEPLTATTLPVTGSSEPSLVSTAGAVPATASSSDLTNGGSTISRSGSPTGTTVKSTSVGVSPSARASPSSAVSHGAPLGATGGAVIGIVCTLLVLGLIGTIIFLVRRRQRMRLERTLRRRQLLEAELDSTPQLEDTSAAEKDDRHAHHPDVPAKHEVYELDVRISRVLPAMLRVGHYSNRHEMDDSWER